MADTNVKQVIYLSGIVNGKKLPKHLSSRKNVENILWGGFNLTVSRANAPKDVQKKKVIDIDVVLDNIWKTGGENRWYYGNWPWNIREFPDKLNGGVGLRLGRTRPNRIFPGEAWLEFKIDENNTLHQTAIFRPRGLKGRLYWYSILPFHYLSLVE